MAWKSSADRYGGVAATIHWVTALAVLFMLGSGLAMERMEDATALLRVHAITGVTVGVLTVLRIVWWVAVDRRPDDVAGISRGQALAAHLVHYGLYAAILVMVSSGLATMVLTGANLQIFGGAPGPLPDFNTVPPFAVHEAMFKILIVLALGHIAAALWHHFIRRDGLLARMGLGR